MADQQSERRVKKIVTGHTTTDGSGVRLYRLIGGPNLPDLDPFLLLDEFFSDDPDDYIGGFPDHPHRGFETVTYMLAGKMRHADSQGNTGVITAGGVQWMTAGSGIVHSEMPEQQKGLLRGFQIWVNLPSASKMTDPRYQDISSTLIPTASPQTGVQMRVIAGEFGTTRGPILDIDANPIYVDIVFNAAQSLTLPIPQHHNGFLYCYEGDIEVGSVSTTKITRRQLAVLGTGTILRVTGGKTGARVLVVAGRPFGEPIARHGPFVMNTQDEIIAAIDDFRKGRFC